jgi:formylglycine-generating enzyme required for sulfatase activity
MNVGASVDSSGVGAVDSADPEGARRELPAAACALPRGPFLGAILGVCLVGCADLNVPLLGTIPDFQLADSAGADSLGDGAGIGAESCVETPSCSAGATSADNCGPSGAECCCTSLEVLGGTFDRTYTVNPDGGPTGLADPATVSAFRLDKYDVTVGRFRSFVSAWNGGYAPPAASGKHTHLNAGQGLANAASPGTFEPGWVASYDANLAPTTVNLTCTMNPTWTDSAGANESKPINCMNWYEAYAFCIWDGGFLPSEAEWEYAAAAGTQQREYPWGTATPGTDNQYAIYGCYYPDRTGTCVSVVNIAPVGTPTLGAGLWGQVDLVGDVSDWNLDSYANYVNPCADCANLSVTLADRVRRGGDFHQPASDLEPWERYDDLPSLRGSNVGFRCARTP